jgi:putative MFS transporter
MTAPSVSAAGAATIQARMDATPVARWHRNVARLLGIGCFFNFFEVALGSLIVTLLPATWIDTSTEKAAVIACAFAGEFIGAVALSAYADRLGRRRMFQINLFAYAALSLICAFAPSLAALIAIRFLVGIGLGAELTLVDTYTTELMPARARGRMLAKVYLFGMLGVPVGATLATLLPHDVLGTSSWRVLIALSAVGAVFVWLVRRRLPESPRWLAAQGRIDEADAILDLAGIAPAEQAGAVVSSSRSEGSAPASVPRRRLALAMLLQTIGPVGFYGFASLAPLVLLAKGYDVVDSLAVSALTVLGYPAGCLVLMLVAERIQRRTLLIATTVLVAIFGVVFGVASQTWLIVVAGFLTGLVNVVQATVSRAYCAELFPTPVRARMVGGTYSLSRLVAAILPFVAIPLLDFAGPGAVYSCCAVLIAILAVSVWRLGPRTNAINLDEV